MENIQIFSDFDGTITKKDTLNEFLRINADVKWLEIEQRWIDGEIGSKQCLKEQIQLFKYFPKKKIDEFIKNVEIDDSFVEFYNVIKSNGVELYILSDGLDYFIEGVLANNGIFDAKIYSNKLIINNNSLDIEFPHSAKNCDVKAGMCKCSVVDKYMDGKQVIYIGDGISDFCVSKKADFLFAKGKLLDYYRNYGDKEVIPFSDFSQILEYIRI